MTFKRSYRVIGSGLLKLLGVVAAIAFSVFLVTVRDEHGRHDRQGMILLFLAPAILGVLAYGTFVGVGQIWRGLTRYAIDERGITVIAPLGRRVVPWSWVDDFALLPGAFPKPPAQLVLIPTTARRMTFDLRRLSPADAAQLMRWFPPLAAHGVDRPREPTRGPLPARSVRWRLYRDDLTVAASAFGFFVLSSLAIGVIAWHTADYLRIRRHPVTLVGHVDAYEIDRGAKHEHTYAQITFAAPDGRAIHLRREVRADMPLTRAAGAAVDVEALASDPHVARIVRYDVDSREWLLLIFAVPFLAICAIALRSSLARWLLPLSDRFDWKPGEAFAVELSKATLFSLQRALPERHVGALVLTPRQRRHESRADLFADRLRKAGLAPRIVGDALIVLDAAHASLFLARLSGDDDYIGRYAVLPAETIDEAERAVLALPGLETGTIDDAAWRDARLFRWRAVGPFGDDAARRDFFDRWITTRLARLYGGVLPRDVPSVATGALLGITPERDALGVRLERRRQGPRVWVRVGEATTARLIECDRGRWVAQGDVALPPGLRPKRTLGRWVLLAALSPIWLFAWLHGLLFVGLMRLLRPLVRRDARRKAARIERARQAAGVFSVARDEEAASDGEADRAG